MLVLHNVTPHVHAEELSDEMPSGIGDWLEFAFSIDPGSGHLECFSKAEAIDMEVLPEIVVAIVPSVEEKHAGTEFAPEPYEIGLSPPPDAPDIAPHTPRPPPLFV